MNYTPRWQKFFLIEPFTKEFLQSHVERLCYSEQAGELHVGSSFISTVLCSVDFIVKSKVLITTVALLNPQ